MLEIKVSELLSSLTNLLSDKIDTARLDVELLICHALNWRREKLYTESDYVLSQCDQDKIQGLINRRLAGEPIAYILGSQEFWSLSFYVTPATLIPRPETEHLVEAVLELIPADQSYVIADLGTGSGAIALSIAKERPQSCVVAIDSSVDALKVAEKNKASLNIQNVEFIESDWFKSIEDKTFDVIVSNPPYIAENDSHLFEGDVRFEPQAALTSGSEGLDDIDLILSAAKSHLNENGWIFLEHGYDQAESIQGLMRKYDYHSISTRKDLSGHERITFAKK